MLQDSLENTELQEQEGEFDLPPDALEKPIWADAARWAEQARDAIATIARVGVELAELEQVNDQDTKPGGRRGFVPRWQREEEEMERQARDRETERARASLSQDRLSAVQRLQEARLQFPVSKDKARRLWGAQSFVIDLQRCVKRQLVLQSHSLFVSSAGRLGAWSRACLCRQRHGATIDAACTLTRFALWTCSLATFEARTSSWKQQDREVAAVRFLVNACRRSRSRSRWSMQCSAAFQLVVTVRAAVVLDRFRREREMRRTVKAREDEKQRRWQSIARIQAIVRRRRQRTMNHVDSARHLTTVVAASLAHRQYRHRLELELKAEGRLQAMAARQQQEADAARRLQAASRRTTSQAKARAVVAATATPPASGPASESATASPSQVLRRPLPGLPGEQMHRDTTSPTSPASPAAPRRPPGHVQSPHPPPRTLPSRQFLMRVRGDSVAEVRGKIRQIESDLTSHRLLEELAVLGEITYSPQERKYEAQIQVRTLAIAPPKVLPESATLPDSAEMVAIRKMQAYLRRWIWSNRPLIKALRTLAHDRAQTQRDTLATGDAKYTAPRPLGGAAGQQSGGEGASDSSTVSPQPPRSAVNPLRWFRQRGKPQPAASERHKSPSDSEPPHPRTTLAAASVDGDEPVFEAVEASLRTSIVSIDHAVVVGVDRSKPGGGLCCLVSLQTDQDHPDNAHLPYRKQRLPPAIIKEAATYGSSATTVEEAKTCRSFRQFMIYGMMKANQQVGVAALCVRQFGVVVEGFSSGGDDPDLTGDGRPRRRTIQRRFASVVAAMCGAPSQQLTRRPNPKGTTQPAKPVREQSLTDLREDVGSNLAHSSSASASQQVVEAAGDNRALAVTDGHVGGGSHGSVGRKDSTGHWQLSPKLDSSSVTGRELANQSPWPGALSPGPQCSAGGAGAMPVLSGVTAALLEAGQGTKADPESGSGVSSGRGGQLSASAGLGLLMSVMEPTGTGTDTELRASPVNGAVVAATAPLEEVVESEVGVKPVGDGAVEGGDESPKDTSHLETTRQLSSETATDALPTEQSHTPRTIPFQPGGFRAKKPAVVPSLPLQNLSPATPSRQQPTQKTFQAEVGPPVSGTHNFTSMGSSPRTVVSSSGTARVTATVRPKRTQRGAVTDRL